MWGLAFVAPAVGLFAVFGVYTVGYGLLLSFARWNGISPDWTWVGLGNFRDLLYADPVLAPRIRSSLITTLIVMVALPAAVAVISFPIAYLLNRIRRLRGFLRTVFFLPYVTAGIAVFYAWRFIYEPNGILNAVLGLLQLDGLVQPAGFLGNPNTALGATVVVLVWANVPLGILLFLTGLQSIPDELIEASQLDGASTARTMRSVVLPLLNPITALLVVVELREALQNYQLFLLLTNGGPVGRTTTLGLETYQFAFGQQPDLGYASALGWLLAVVAGVLAVANFMVLRSRT